MCNLLQCMWLQTVSIFFPPSKPTPEVLTDYTRKVEFLKGILDAEKLVSIDESCAVTNTVQIVLIVIFSTGEMLYVITVKRKKFRVPFFSSVFNNRALANQLLAPGRTPTIANERTPASKTVHMQTKARCTEEMRNELLGTVRGLAYFKSTLTFKST